MTTVTAIHDQTTPQAGPEAAHRGQAADRHPDRPLVLRRRCRSSRCSPPSRSPGAAGCSWTDVGDRPGLLRRRRPRHHGRLPPLLHARLVQGQALAAGDPRGGRLVRDRGHVDPVGGRPPPAPRVLRPGGRPALAVALRRRLLGPDQGPVLRARGLAVRPRAVQPRRASPRTCWPTRTSAGSTSCSRCSWSLSVRLAGARRRPGHLVVAGRADRVLLGRPGAHRRCCTT